MEEMATYLEKIALPQVKELLTQYNPDIIWFDTPRRMSASFAEPFSRLIRKISPNTLINSRLFLDGSKMSTISEKNLAALKKLDVDYLSYADREIPSSSPWENWETCMTLNGSWGFTKGDNKWKTPTHVIQQLFEVVSKNGTFLLNVGPRPDGSFPTESVAVLKQVGDWLKLNGDAVYGAKPVSFNIEGTPTAASLQRKADKEARFAKLNRPAPHTSLERDFPWIATRKGDTIFIAVFDWPADNALVIENFSEKITDARLSSNPDASLQTRLDGKTLRISLPRNPGGDLPPVIRLSLNETFDNK
jgi:alpha-L-fucosidase